MSDNQFLSEVDLQVIRMGSEIMLLRNIVDEQKKINRETVDNLKATVAAKEALEHHAKALELQIDGMKGQFEAMDYYAKMEKMKEKTDGSRKVLRRTSAKAQFDNPKRNGNGKSPQLRGGE